MIIHMLLSFGDIVISWNTEFCWSIKIALEIISWELDNASVNMLHSMTRLNYVGYIHLLIQSAARMKEKLLRIY